MIIADNAASEFFRFIGQYPAEQSKHHTCLADYVYAWLLHGKGVKECAEDFGVYLQAFLLISERYFARPELLDYTADHSLPSGQEVERRPKRIFDQRFRVTHNAFQLDVFKAIVANYPDYWEVAEECIKSR